MTNSFVRRFAEVNRELWVVLSLLLVCLLMNYGASRILSEHRMMLSFYVLPTILSAYWFGPIYKDIVVYALFAALLWLRPQGLMGKA